MSGEKPEVKNTEEPEKPKVKKIIVKKKETIEERQYTDKLVDCAEAGFWAGAGAIFGGNYIVAVESRGRFLGIPFVLHKLTFLRTTVLIRQGTGFFSGIVLSYFAAKAQRERCERKVAENYQY